MKKQDKKRKTSKEGRNNFFLPSLLVLQGSETFKPQTKNLSSLQMPELQKLQFCIKKSQHSCSAHLVSNVWTSFGSLWQNTVAENPSTSCICSFKCHFSAKVRRTKLIQCRSIKCGSSSTV